MWVIDVIVFNSMFGLVDVIRVNRMLFGVLGVFMFYVWVCVLLWFGLEVFILLICSGVGMFFNRCWNLVMDVFSRVLWVNIVCRLFLVCVMYGYYCLRDGFGFFYEEVFCGFVSSWCQVVVFYELFDFVCIFKGGQVVVG